MFADIFCNYVRRETDIPFQFWLQRRHFSFLYSTSRPLSLSFTINVIIKGNHKYFFYSAVYQFKSIHVGRDQNRVCKGVGLQGTSLKIHQDQRQNKVKRTPVPQGFQQRNQHFCQTSGKWKAWFSRLHSKIHWTKKGFPLGRWTQRRRIK